MTTTSSSSNPSSASSSSKPPDTPKRNIRLGLGVDCGGFLLESEEKEFQY